MTVVIVPGFLACRPVPCMETGLGTVSVLGAKACVNTSLSRVHNTSKVESVRVDPVTVLPPLRFALLANL